MKLFFFKGAKDNFGDELNEWLWERLAPGVWDQDESVRVSVIGTLISHEFMKKAPRWIVFGSGAGYAAAPEGFGGEGWTILSVRGPLSAEVLGLDPSLAVTDGALLLSLLEECQPLPESEREGIVFMPHHNALEKGAWSEVCQRAGINYIDPTDKSVQTLQRLRRAKLVVADAMHAAIVADTLRVPWVPVATSRQINTFKWMDWTLSMELPYRPLLLPCSTMRESLRNGMLPFRGEGFWIENPDPAKAVAHYKKMQKLKAQSWWPRAKKLANDVEDLLDKGLAWSERYGNGGKPWAADSYLDAAAAALKQASEAPSYLSDEAVFLRRKGQMAELLTKLKP